MVTIINIIITLIITVIGGLIVYFFTRKKAQLTYYFSDQTDFSRMIKGQSEKITFQNLIIKNLGNKTSTDISIILDGSFLQKNNIEYDIKTIEQHEKFIGEQNNINIKYKRMLPKDSFTISFLQRGNNPIKINKELIVSARCNETKAIDEKKYTKSMSPRDWILMLFVYGVLGLMIYLIVSKITKDNRVNIPKSTITFSLNKLNFEKEGDTLQVKTYVVNKEKEVITSLYWNIRSSGFALYEIDTLNRNHLNPGGFYRQAILDTNQIDVRYGIIIIPKNIPDGKYFIQATCYYYIGDIYKIKEFRATLVRLTD